MKKVLLSSIAALFVAGAANAACTTPSDNGMPAGNIPILKMSAGSGSFGAAPSTDVPTGGEMYFDVGLSQMIWCDGVNWMRLDGTQAFNEPALTAKVEEVANAGGSGGGASGADPLHYNYSYVYRGRTAAPCTGMMKETYIQRNGPDLDTMKHEYLVIRGDSIDISKTSYSGSLYCLN